MAGAPWRGRSDQLDRLACRPRLAEPELSNPPKRRVEPYACPYCGSVTTSQNEARARLCMRCVRFEGDVHPAITGARIAAHNARIMGISKKMG